MGNYAIKQRFIWIVVALCLLVVFPKFYNASSCNGFVLYAKGAGWTNSTCTWQGGNLYTYESLGSYSGASFNWAGYNSSNEIGYSSGSYLGQYGFGGSPSCIYNVTQAYFPQETYYKISIYAAGMQNVSCNGTYIKLSTSAPSKQSTSSTIASSSTSSIYPGTTTVYNSAPTSAYYTTTSVDIVSLTTIARTSRTTSENSSSSVITENSSSTIMMPLSPNNSSAVYNNSSASGGSGQVINYIYIAIAISFALLIISLLIAKMRRKG